MNNNQKCSFIDEWKEQIDFLKSKNISNMTQNELDNFFNEWNKRFEKKEIRNIDNISKDSNSLSKTSEDKYIASIIEFGKQNEFIENFKLIHGGITLENLELFRIEWIKKLVAF